MYQENLINTNQLSEKLDLDYKTIRHHIKKLLEENNIIVSSGDKYGTMYFLSNEMENNRDIFEEIWRSVEENK